MLVLLGGVILSLVIGSLPAFQAFGLRFLTSETWNPNDDVYGALGAIYGTIVTSALAMAIAIPVGLGIAIFLSELCPFPLRKPIGMAIELLAGIPSIIYGIWGLFIFAPFLQTYVEPPLIAVLGPIPVLGALFQGPPYGIGMLTAGHHPRHHGAAFHQFHFARCLRDGAARAQGSGLRPRLHDMGGREQHRDPLFADRCPRRRHAGFGPGAWRDHGGHVRDRQCP